MVIKVRALFRTQAADEWSAEIHHHRISFPVKEEIINSNDLVA